MEMNVVEPFSVAITAANGLWCISLISFAHIQTDIFAHMSFLTLGSYKVDGKWLQTSV